MVDREADGIDYGSALALGVFGIGGGEVGLGLPVGGLEFSGGELVLAVGFIIGLVVDLVDKRRVIGELGVQARASNRGARREGVVRREVERRTSRAHRRRSMMCLCCVIGDSVDCTDILRRVNWICRMGWGVPRGELTRLATSSVHTALEKESYTSATVTVSKGVMVMVTASEVENN